MEDIMHGILSVDCKNYLGGTWKMFDLRYTVWSPVALFPAP